MLEPLSALDWLSEQFATTNQRLAVTALAVGAMVFVLLASQTLQRWLNERIRPLYADIVTTVVLLGTFVVGLSVTLGVWGQTGEVQQMYAERDLGGDFVARLIVSFVVLVGTYIVARFLKRVLRELLESSAAVSQHQHEVTHRVSQVVLWGASLVIVLSVWTDDLGGLLVGAGFLGIVVGMAARQTLGALIAGFVLMFARPFEVGDWVEIDEREGIVTDISIVNTRIRTFDGEYVEIPNDLVGSSMVTNRSANGQLRLEVDVGIDYEADVEYAREIALEALADVDDAVSNPNPGVVTKQFGDSAVVLGVRFWIDEPTAPKRSRARTAAIDAIKTRFDDEGIGIPYPQRELSHRDGTEVDVGERRASDDAKRSAGPSTTSPGGE
ncbi:mechanosensitive ion channel family protein [Natrialbaceae archaeon AArc-T1-2]|uniref:mechanosensitive ion channel family protein n=1 Tax=Natrialbaceae archaeon AArc-T1-2 TaxID=3053904 RepID=UPI00255AB74E|nr:mechanosensitive ion channel family protein [Natrialbaceae archaeon AArc-T1-2]WIV65952.1 mechanosensitive ion channel family protein [Natrialbaceae archaeon AArc-T1-2]